jgi:very-short-patch-repair endonuclease
MRYQWGPLLRDGGERRLNVAATRARRRLTVVSSFSSHDVDPSRLTAPGARLLAEYLEYARAGGVPVAPVRPGDDGSAGAFHADVAARLAALGITVVPQYGVGGYRVDFAAAHPDDPSRMILAIEADGAGYRDSGSVRDRDRLRKEHLERLGWHVHRLWSTAWFTDPAGELARLRAAFDSAVSAAPPPPQAPASQSRPEPPVTPRPAASPGRGQAPGPGEAPKGRAAGADLVTRVIPMGSGERPQLRGSGARALPAPGITGPAAARPERASAEQKRPDPGTPDW